VSEDTKNKSNPLEDLNSDENQNQVASSKEKSSLDESDSKFNRFECLSCGFVYDPDEGIKKLNIAPGTAFLDLDKDNFRCPVCRVGFGGYKDIGSKSKPSGFEENLTYGFGFNKLPSGQKNVLIFGSLALAAACFLSLYSLK
tara:strand:+ start:279 stop:704 length:426 start_codon:yes stop_codon:yes gene_type:complete